MIRTRKGKAWWGRSPSSRKAARSSASKHIINKMRRSKIKTCTKKALPGVGNQEGVISLRVAQKVIMGGVAKGVLKLNRASRIVSRLAKKLKQASLAAKNS
jgi:small subunit ribosomal protein S20